MTERTPLSSRAWRDARGKWLSWLLLLLILLAGGSLRYTYMQDTLVPNPAGAGDAGYYVRYAHNLLDYGVFSRDNEHQPPIPDAYWSPGYPAFLAAIIHSSNVMQADAYRAVQATQMVLGTLAILLTWLLAASFMPAIWALLPAALVAASPHLVSTAFFLVSETLTMFLLLAALLLLVKGIEGRSSTLLTAAGIAFALSYLSNPVTLFTAPVALAAAWLGSRGAAEEASGRRGWQRAALLVTLPLLATVLAWSLRGAISVPADSSSSADRLLTNLVQGMHEDFHAVWRADPRDPNNPATLDMARVDGSYSAFYRIFSEQFAREPGSMLLWYLVKKPLLLWDWEIRVGAGDIYIYPIFFSPYQTSRPILGTYVVMRSLHPWLFAAAVLALVYLPRTRQRNSPVALMLYLSLVYLSAVYTVAQAAPRYSIPLRPEMYILATFFFWQLTLSYRRYREHYRARHRAAAAES